MKTPCSKCGKTVDEHYRTTSGLIACGEPPKAEAGFLHFATSFYMPASYTAGFEAGLRRAAELAKEHVKAEQLFYWKEYCEHYSPVDWSDFDATIDAEAKKG